jgi:acyl carrier protein
MVADEKARKTPSVADFVVRTVAMACRADPAVVSRRTTLQALKIDSLTLVAVLTQVEVEFDLDFSAADTAELLSATDVDALVTAIELKIACRER